LLIKKEGWVQYYFIILYLFVIVILNRVHSATTAVQQHGVDHAQSARCHVSLTTWESHNYKPKCCTPETDVKIANFSFAKKVDRHLKKLYILILYCI